MRNQGHFETNMTSFVTVFSGLDLASLQMLTIEEFVGSPVATGRWQNLWKAEEEVMLLEIWPCWDLIPFFLLHINHQGNGFSRSTLIPCQEKARQQGAETELKPLKLWAQIILKLITSWIFLIRIQRWVLHSWITSLPFLKTFVFKEVLTLSENDIN